MALSLPISIDGECVCSVCCKRVWRSYWDCDTLTWGTPTLDSSEVVKGPCPSDIDWALDGGTVDPCDAIYTQYSPLTDVCKDCSDIPEVPPAGPSLPQPSECCDNDVCWHVWIANADCASNTWLASTVIAGPFCDSPGAIPGPTGTWYVDPLYGDCPVFKVVSITSCVDSGDCPSEGAAPTPATPPNPPSFYTDCCPGGCCVTWEIDGGDCVSNTWNAPTVSFKECAIEGECDSTWVQFSPLSCVWTYSVWTAGACVDPDVDCPDGTPPPSDPPGLPNDYPGCCVCCFYLYEATYSCEDPVGWTVAFVSKVCDSCDETDPFGVTGGALNSWVVDSGDPCHYYQTLKPGDRCDGATDCTPPPPPPDPFGGGEPSDCCTGPTVCGDDEGVTCYTFWISSPSSDPPYVPYLCNSGCYEDDTEALNSFEAMGCFGGSAGASIGAWFDYSPFDYGYVQRQDPCGEQPADEPEIYCNCTYSSGWDCESEVWSTPVLIGSCTTDDFDGASPWAYDVFACDAITTVSELGACD